MIQGPDKVTYEVHQRMTHLMQQRSELYRAFGWYYYYEISDGG